LTDFKALTPQGLFKALPRSQGPPSLTPQKLKNANFKDLTPKITQEA